MKEEALNLTGLHSFLSLTIVCVSFLLLANNCNNRKKRWNQRCASWFLWCGASFPVVMMAHRRWQPMAGHHNKWQEIESCRYQRNPFFHGSTLDFLFHLFIVCNGCWIEDRLSAHTIKEKLKEKSCCPSGRKPFHEVRSHGWHHHWITEERPEVNARRSKGNRRRAPKVFFLIRWCWRGSLVERIENVKSWKTARSLSSFVIKWKGKRENV